MKLKVIPIIIVCSVISVRADDVIFTCGNHDPRHSTSDFSEAKDYVKKYSCVGWTVTSPSGKISSADLNELRETLVASSGGTTTTTTGGTSDTITGTVTTFTPGQTIVVKKTGEDPARYVLGKKVEFVTLAGGSIEPSTIKPGTRVQVYYEKMGDTRTVSRVVVEQ